MAIVQSFGPYPNSVKIVSYSTYDYFGNVINVTPSVPLTRLDADTDPPPTVVNNFTITPREQSLILPNNGTGFSTMTYKIDGGADQTTAYVGTPGDVNSTAPRIIENASLNGETYVGFGAVITTVLGPAADPGFLRVRMVKAVGRNGVVYLFADLVAGIMPPNGYTQTIKETVGTVVTNRVVSTPGLANRIFNVVTTVATVTPAIPRGIISNVGYLIGLDVVVLINGALHPPVVVKPNGSVILDPNHYQEGDVVHIGAAYKGFFTTTRMEGVGAQDGTSIAKTKRIHNTSVLIWKSLGGGLQGLDGAKEYFEYRAPSDKMDTKIPLSSGFILTPNPDGYNTEGTVTVFQDQPFAMTVLSLEPQLEVQDR